MGRDIQMTEALSDYITDHLVDEPAIFRELREETSDLGTISRMQVGWSQARFMQAMAKAVSARRYLEIGVFTGYSSLAVAEILPKDGQIIALDISEEWTAIACKYWEKAGVRNKIDLRLGDAIESLGTLGTEAQFDLAFIDADKENYARYFDAVIGLMRPGGVFLVDNVLWSGRVIDPEDMSEDTVAIRAFNQKLRDDNRVLTSILPVGDGLTFCVKL